MIYNSRQSKRDVSLKPEQLDVFSRISNLNIFNNYVQFVFNLNVIKFNKISLHSILNDKSVLCIFLSNILGILGAFVFPLPFKLEYRNN